MTGIADAFRHSTDALALIAGICPVPTARRGRF